MASYSQTKDDAIKYNDSLIDIQSKVILVEDSLINIISLNIPEKLDNAYDALVAQVNSSLVITNKIKAFNGKTYFKDATLDLLNTYKSVVENEYKKIVKISKIPEEKYTQELDDELMRLSRQVDSKLNTLLNAFTSTQLEFAKEWDFELIKKKDISE